MSSTEIYTCVTTVHHEIYICHITPKFSSCVYFCFYGKCQSDAYLFLPCLFMYQPFFERKSDHLLYRSRATEEPALRGQPTAVVQYNGWKGSGLIAISYEARGFGVKRQVPFLSSSTVPSNWNLLRS
jgi:hypothetical protein